MLQFQWFFSIFIIYCFMSKISNLFYWIFTLFTNDGKDLIRDIVSNIEDCAIDSVLTATHWEWHQTFDMVTSCHATQAAITIGTHRHWVNSYISYVNWRKYWRLKQRCPQLLTFTKSKSTFKGSNMENLAQSREFLSQTICMFVS